MRNLDSPNYTNEINLLIRNWLNFLFQITLKTINTKRKCDLNKPISTILYICFYRISLQKNEIF